MAQNGNGKLRGTVRWFDPAKGYGFISRDDGNRDVFVHFSKIESVNAYKTLEENQRVEFEVIAAKKGPEAVSVRVIS